MERLNRQDMSKDAQRVQTLKKENCDGISSYNNKR